LFLRDHANDISATPDIKLAKLIRDQFVRRQAPIPPEGWLENQLDQGTCLVMLDGLDEVADLAVRNSVVKWVEQCMSAYSKNRFVLSSRPHGYKTNPLEKVTVLQVKPFTSAQVKQFVHNWYLANEMMSSQRNDPGVHADANLGADDLVKRIYNTPTLSELAVNPLLLTMIATVHRFRSSLPGRRVELYAEICEVFLGKHHEAHGVTSNLTPAQKQRVIQPLAYYLMQENTREIKLANIQPVIEIHLAAVRPNATCADFIKEIENNSGLLVERESGEYTFSHQTFQEYLAAVHILENRLESKLVDCVDKSWWHETIRLYCAQADASSIVQVCLRAKSASTFGLAIDCMDEAREVNLEVRKSYDSLIEKGIESSDPELRRLIAEARLATRLSKS
jgi:predicted NACHT family NTPase